MTGWPERILASYAVGDRPATVDVDAEPVTVDVALEQWPGAVLTARYELGCTFFDWLSAVDETDTLDGYRLVCHLAAHRPGAVDHLVLRTLVPREHPVAASVGGVYAGARWHERETHEMFGIDFTEDGAVLELAPLLLPTQFEGHPLRKEFVLAARVATPWPGEKEPGESDSTPVPRRSRRRARPLGIPEPGTWGARDDHR